MRLEVQNVSVTIHNKSIVKDVSLSVADGEFVGILGPNGSGKSTLLRAIYGLGHRYDGQILWDGRDATEISRRDFARKVAVVSQFNSLSFDFTVREIVSLGRSPHQSALSKETDHDESIVSDVIQKVGLSRFEDRSFATLSGGEKQRVMLAQEPEFLVLDEPTNHLDITYQIDILRLVRNLGISCLAVLHDIVMAAHYVDRLYFLKEGTIVSEGTPEDIVTPELLADVYGVEGMVRPSTAGNGISIDYVY
ncbi:MAG: ABC transporter ATP-binding protein [Atopobium sp.]|nr:ABC transporter ATP-binding protein [Atopobium sp.]